MTKPNKTLLIAVAALLIASAYPAYYLVNVVINHFPNQFSCNTIIPYEVNLSGSGFQTLQQGQDIIFANEPVKITALFDKNMASKIKDIEVYLKRDYATNDKIPLCNISSQTQEGIFECDFKVDSSVNSINYGIFLDSSRNDCKINVNDLTGSKSVFLAKKYRMGETATNGKISVKVYNLEYSKDTSHEGWNIFSYNTTVENINNTGEISPMNFDFVTSNGEYLDRGGTNSWMFNLNLRIGEKESGKIWKSVRNETSISEIIYSSDGSYFIFYV